MYTIIETAKLNGLDPEAYLADVLERITASAHNSLPKLAQAMEAAEDDVLAYMTFPAAHRQKLHRTNTLERLNKEVKRRADVVGIFPNEASIIRSTGRWARIPRHRGRLSVEGMMEARPTI